MPRKTLSSEQYFRTYGVIFVLHKFKANENKSFKYLFVAALASRHSLFFIVVSEWALGAYGSNKWQQIKDFFENSF